MRSICKNTMLAAAMLSILIAMPTVAGDDEEAIFKVIEDSYVKAIHTKFDEAAIMNGFHPEFIMFVKADEGVRQVTIADWVNRMKGSIDPNAAPNNVRYEPNGVSVNGGAASASVNLYLDDKLTFTDFFLLYKIDGEWKIVGKIFNRH